MTSTTKRWLKLLEVKSLRILKSLEWRADHMSSARQNLVNMSDSEFASLYIH